MKPSFFNRFRRVTYSTGYIPEIDGLRFLAIFSVVVILHITGYLNDKAFGLQLVQQGYWQDVVSGGGAGVAFFFIISGFILSLPFARWRLTNAVPVDLRRYYLRRLTRLEPPYLIALLILFVAQVWILKSYTVQLLAPHLLASAFYVHNFVYQTNSPILPVAWSLEVEVQFYLLAPLLFLVYRIRNNQIRLLIYPVVIVTGACYWFGDTGMPHLLKFIQNFFGGMLLADLYCREIRLLRSNALRWAVGSMSLAGFFFLPSIHSFGAYLLRAFCMLVIFHLALTPSSFARIFSFKPFVLIGGMCYSIYLLHFAIISMAGRAIQPGSTQSPSVAQFLLLAIFLSAAVLLLSAIYFLLVEKPFMKPLRPLRKSG